LVLSSDVAPDVAAPAAGIAQAAGLAHDAGNLLGALGLYCDLLYAPGVLRPEHLHYAAELKLISSRSSELIRRLLNAPRAQSQTQAAGSQRAERAANRPEPPLAGSSARELLPADVRRRDALLNTATGCANTLCSALRNLSPVLERIAAGSAHVSVYAPATLPSIDLPTEALERITVNLVRNAAEAIRTQRVHGQCMKLRHAEGYAAARTPGRIRVTLSLVAAKLQLSVEDDGPGVPPDVAAAFLQPKPLPAHSSRGLGHRIVHELVTSSGGQLSIRVRPNQGTAFCIKWPIFVAENDRQEIEAISGTVEATRHRFNPTGISHLLIPYRP
jgi:signal transduction histidine kinase